MLNRTDIPGVFKSTDSGDHWTQVFQTSETGGSNNQSSTTGHQGDGGILSWWWSSPNIGLDVSDLDANRVLITGDFPYLTEDGGTTWKQLYVNPKYENPINTTIPRPKSYLHTGLGVTTGHWLHWTAADTMFAASTDIGLQRTTDGGCTWTTDYTPFDGSSLIWTNWYAIAQQPGTSRLYAAVASVNDFYEVERLDDGWVNQPTGQIWGSVLYSDDQGQSWLSLAGGVSGGPSGNFPGPVIQVAIDPSQTNHIYACVAESKDITTQQQKGGIYRSTNGGTNWSKLTNPPRTEGRPLTVAVLGTNQLVATFCGRTVDDGNGNQIFTDSSGVFYSSNSGSSWSDVSAAGMHYFTRDLVVNPANNANWFVAVQSRVTGGNHANPAYDGNGGVYRTTNSGTGWTKIWTKDTVVSVTYVNGTTPLLYVTTFDDGLWVSTNPGAATPTFTKVTAFPFSRARRVFDDPYRTDATIWVTTQGGGLWRGSVVPTMSSSIARNGANFDVIADVADTGGSAPTLTGITSLASSPGGWSTLAGITPTVTYPGGGITRYTWASVNLHSLFTGLSGGFARATRTRGDGSAETGEAVGWIVENIPANTTESWGVPWLKAPLYRGAAATASSTTVVLHTPLAAGFTSGKSYYLELAEGGSAGHRLEIDESASSGAVITLDLASALNTTATLPDLNGELVRIREHWTMTEVFDKALFHSTNNNATADRILLYNTPTSAYITYWLYTNLGVPKWVQVGDAYLNDAGGRVIPPGEGWFVQPKATMNGSLPGHGLVRDHAFRQYYGAGTTFSSLGFPVLMSPASNHLLAADGFLAGNNTQGLPSDKFLVWLGDAASPSATWQTYWYWIGGSGYSTRWVRSGDATLASQDTTLLFNPQRSFMAQLKTTTPPHTVSRTVPRPWTP